MQAEAGVLHRFWNGLAIRDCVLSGLFGRRVLSLGPGRKLHKELKTGVLLLVSLDVEDSLLLYVVVVFETSHLRPQYHGQHSFRGPRSAIIILGLSTRLRTRCRRYVSALSRSEIVLNLIYPHDLQEPLLLWP